LDFQQDSSADRRDSAEGESVDVRISLKIEINTREREAYDPRGRFSLSVSLRFCWIWPSFGGALSRWRPSNPGSFISSLIVDHGEAPRPRGGKRDAHGQDGANPRSMSMLPFWDRLS